jgi:thymidylate synthase
MRFYQDFPEAISELRRELKEMGIRVHSKSVQNLDISDKPEFDSLELQNYTYTVLNPNIDLIPIKNMEWAEAEFKDRISGKEINPGEAYKLRPETWSHLLNEYGMFDYTYPNRLSDSLAPAIRALKKDLYTRRAFIAVFNPWQDMTDRFNTRIPCTLGYWLNFRKNALNITYLLRSSDFSEHFNYDVYLATRLMIYVAEQIGVQPGAFTHWIDSFHVFKKDVEGVF